MLVRLVLMWLVLAGEWTQDERKAVREMDEELFRKVVRACLVADDEWGLAARNGDQATMRKSKSRLWAPDLAALMTTLYKTHLPQINVRQSASAFGNSDATKNRLYTIEGDHVTVRYEGNRADRTFVVEWPDDDSRAVPDRVEGRMTRAVPGAYIRLQDKHDANKTHELPNPRLPGGSCAGHPGRLSRAAIQGGHAGQAFVL
mgnify:CR=1 FL=1